MTDDEQFSRTKLLIGDSGLDALGRAHVIVFGVGGVGGFAVEALARAGVGALDIVDSDTVALSNLNRQIIALHSTLGKYKESAHPRYKSCVPSDCAQLFFSS